MHKQPLSALPSPAQLATIAAGRRQGGNIVIVASLILVALFSLASLTVISVQGGMASAGHDRFRSVALYAAESGAAAGMDFLRRNLDPATNWGALVNPNNQEPLQKPSGIPGNEIPPGQPGNLLSAELRAWYEVEIVNNINDPGYGVGNDADGRVIIRSTGHGPNGTVARIEWEVKMGSNTSTSGRPCPAYGQAGIDADGAGLNDCMGTISSDVTTYTIDP